jgi:hypothetical protein
MGFASVPYELVIVAIMLRLSESAAIVLGLPIGEVRVFR